MWQDVAKMSPGPARDDVGTLRGDREPSEVLAPAQEIVKAFTRFRAQDLE